MMEARAKMHEHLVLSRGQWDATSSPEDIEAAIATFYEWYERNVGSGRFKPGSRLTTAIAVVSKDGIIVDGPFGETKEVIGGYWSIMAGSLAEAAAIAAENPCIQHGLRFEIRPLEAERASVHKITNEGPAR
jgi:hypothetical protein